MYYKCAILLTIWIWCVLGSSLPRSWLQTQRIKHPASPLDVDLYIASYVDLSHISNLTSCLGRVCTLRLETVPHCINKIHVQCENLLWPYSPSSCYHQSVLVAAVRHRWWPAQSAPPCSASAVTRYSAKIYWKCHLWQSEKNTLATASEHTGWGEMLRVVTASLWSSSIDITTKDWLNTCISKEEAFDYF